MSYSGFKEDLLDFITSYQMNLFSKTGDFFIFNNRDIYDLYDGCESTKDASDALNSLWKYDGELARIEVSKIDKELISDRESVPSKGYFYALAKYAPQGFEMHEKFKLDDKKEIKTEINVVFTEPEMLEINEMQAGYYPGGMMHGGFDSKKLITNNKETEMDEVEKEYVISVWTRETANAESDLHEALIDPIHEFTIDSFADVEEYMTELRRLQDEYAARYRMAKKQLDALK